MTDTPLNQENEWLPVQDMSQHLAVSLAKECVPKYFSDGFNPIDLRGYLARNHFAVLEVQSREGKHGYAFVGELQLDRDIEKRLGEVRRLYEGEGKTIERLFLDLRDRERFAGLEWRMRYGSFLVRPKGEVGVTEEYDGGKNRAISINLKVVKDFS